MLTLPSPISSLYEMEIWILASQSLHENGIRSHDTQSQISLTCLWESSRSTNLGTDKMSRESCSCLTWGSGMCLRLAKCHCLQLHNLNVSVFGKTWTRLAALCNRGEKTSWNCQRQSKHDLVTIKWSNIGQEASQVANEALWQNNAVGHSGLTCPQESCMDSSSVHSVVEQEMLWGEAPGDGSGTSCSVLYWSDHNLSAGLSPCLTLEQCKVSEEGSIISHEKLRAWLLVPHSWWTVVHIMGKAGPCKRPLREMKMLLRPLSTLKCYISGF